ncbi:Uncharacterised protein [Mycobacteroides abscessus subsp. abscessus]|nr:Uncharacterised protein [Mycobacteroides abscessus subsp. abscessus]
MTGNAIRITSRLPMTVEFVPSRAPMWANTASSSVGSAGLSAILQGATAEETVS